MRTDDTQPNRNRRASHGRAANRAAAWVRDQHPAVWAQLIAEAAAAMVDHRSRGWRRSQAIHSRARNRAASWVRRQHPAVYAQLIAEVR